MSKHILGSFRNSINISCMWVIINLIFLSSFSEKLEDRMFQSNSHHSVFSNVVTKHQWNYKDGKMQKVYLRIITLQYSKPYQSPEILTFSCSSLTLNKGPISELSKPNKSSWALSNLHWRKHPTPQMGSLVRSLCMDSTIPVI